ncbi:hypothetical protein NDU88_007387 [Pleurodeles waltl]|uniref:Uncharacterized protein n=1 Tax=Pleurodeles waltl TaxID=8319 RepID=A0AAV7VTD9_PLEWA|nr:hypothetical protein NDU88_007387 [Pleurodeles waltl]
MTPDFQVPGIENREDGRQSKKEEEKDAVEPKETASGDRDQHKRSSGNPDVPRAGADPVKEERSEDTRGGRHVPGGAWLIKVLIRPRGRQLLYFDFQAIVSYIHSIASPSQEDAVVGFKGERDLSLSDSWV